MPTFSDDPAVEEAVTAAHADYAAAQEALIAERDGDGITAETKADYDAKKLAFANARSAARGERTMGVVAEAPSEGE